MGGAPGGDDPALRGADEVHLTRAGGLLDGFDSLVELCGESGHVLDAQRHQWRQVYLLTTPLKLVGQWPHESVICEKAVDEEDGT